MSFVITNPEALTVAATEVRRIRDRAIQSDAQVAPMTTAVRASGCGSGVGEGGDVPGRVRKEVSADHRCGGGGS